MAYLTPAREIVDSDAFSETLTALVALKTDYEADGRASIHVDALVMIMSNLRNDVTLLTPVILEPPVI